MKDLKGNVYYEVEIRVIDPVGEVNSVACKCFFTTVIPDTRNMLLNPSFETRGASFWSHSQDKEYTNRTFATYWEPFLIPYHLDKDTKHKGGTSLVIRPQGFGKKYGAIQVVYIGQQVQQVLLGAWSTNEKILGSEGYCLHMDLIYMDGTIYYGPKIQFLPGNDWQYQCMIAIAEPKPLKAVAVFISVTDQPTAGRMWFDDVFLTTDITDDGKQEYVGIDK